MKKLYFLAVLSALVLLYSGCVVENEEPPRPVELVISEQPTKVEYKKDEPLDLSGLEVTLKKPDGTSAVLTQYTTEPENRSPLTEPGETTVTVTAEGLSATFTITVTAPEEKPDEPTDRLEISKQPTKVGYEKGDKLDLSGLEVTLHKADGTSEVLKAYTTEPENGSELTRLGKQPVAIMAEGLETTFDICVAGLEILQLPKTDYTFYVPLDLSGLEIKRYNTDGTSEVLEQYATEPDDKSILAETGNLLVTIKAEELTETFKISVSDEYIAVGDENHYLKQVPSGVKEKPVNITVPESIVRIEDNVFAGCQSLSEIKLLGMVAEGFGEKAFEEFSGVVRVANGDTRFSGCISLKKVVIEDGVTTICKQAFKDCGNLTSVDIPDSVTSIGEEAFWFCSSLASVEIPSSVTSIEDWTFTGCSSLTSVEIPNSVTFIRRWAFSDCSNLASVKIPSSVTSIGNGAFSDCSSLRSVEIPGSVTSIGGFSGCSSLTSIKIPSSVTSIWGSAFDGCSSLKSIEIPSSVTSIGYYAFRNCKSLTSVVIPNSVTKIGIYTFYGCSGLTSVEIPGCVTSIGIYAFESCSYLESVTYNGSKEDWNKIVVLDAYDKSEGSISSENAHRVGLSGKIIVCTDGDIEY